MSFWDDLVVFTDRVVQKGLGEIYGPPQDEFEKTQKAIQSELSGAVDMQAEKDVGLGEYESPFGKATLYEPGTPQFESEVDRLMGTIDQKEFYMFSPKSVGRGPEAKDEHKMRGANRFSVKAFLRQEANRRLGREANPRSDRVETAADMALQVPDPVKSGMLEAYSRNPHVLDALGEAPGGTVVPWNLALSGERGKYLQRAGSSPRDAGLNDYGKE